jgi:hypothetical protein
VRRLLILSLLLLLSATALGCGGSRERGKNSDLDRPIPQKR